MFNSSRSYYYQERLKLELSHRVERNPRYSLRAYASSLGIAPSALSQILNGKRSISTKVLGRVFQSLEFTAAERRNFIESILKEKEDLGLERVSPQLKKQLAVIESEPPTRDLHDVSLEQYRIISDWYHYAILELSTTRKFKPDVRWIAQQLGISETETKLAIDRLLKLDLLEEGTLKKTLQKITTKDRSKTSTFHRRRQRQILEKAMHSLDHDPIETRNHTGLTFAVNPEQIPEAKERIQKFMWEMSEFLMKGDLERVYELSVLLVPLQKENKEGTEK